MTSLDQYVYFSLNNDIRTNFHGEDNSKKVPKESCTYKCLSLISLDYVSKTSRRV